MPRPFIFAMRVVRASDMTPYMAQVVPKTNGSRTKQCVIAPLRWASLPLGWPGFSVIFGRMVGFSMSPVVLGDTWSWVPPRIGAWWVWTATSARLAPTSRGWA